MIFLYLDKIKNKKLLVKFICVYGILYGIAVHDIKNKLIWYSGMYSDKY